MIQTPSPSRQYVVVLNKPNFDGFCLRSFELPQEHKNTRGMAQWYYLNKLDAMSCLEPIILTKEEVDGIKMKEANSSPLTIETARG